MINIVENSILEFHTTNALEEEGRSDDEDSKSANW